MADFRLEESEPSGPRWVRTGLDDLEVLVKYAGPEDLEKFRLKMIRDGIMRATAAGTDLNQGRERAFFEAWAERFISDWRGISENGQANPTFDHKKMGFILAKRRGAFHVLCAAIENEADFFGGNGNGSTP